MLPNEIKERSLFIGASSSISTMIKDAFDYRNKGLIRDTFTRNPPTHVYFHNYHLLNNYIANLARKIGSLVIYHAHEPYVQNHNKNVYEGYHQYWLYFFEHYQGILLQNTDIAIVSSRYASNLFDIRYPSFVGKKLHIPLFYEDLGSSRVLGQKGQYITFVGPPLPAKGSEKLLEIARYSYKRGLELKLQMISRSRIHDARFLQEKGLEIRFIGRCNDVAFGRLIQRSFATLTPYKRATQSSTILVSYMYGTPVVSSDVGGLPEVVKHSETGYLLKLGANAEKWVEGIDYIRNNFPRLSRNCRRYFADNHSEKNWPKYFRDLEIGTEARC
jgi:glycosyltransferase involved in cell wall biosynthesis